MISDKVVSISLSLTNPPRRIPIELPSPSPSCKLHELASKATTIPESTMRLIYRGRIIPPRQDDNNVIEDFNLEDGSVIHCIGKPTSTASVVATSNNNNSSTANLDSGNSTTVSAGSFVTPPPSNSATATVTRSNELTTSENNGQHPLTQALQTMKSNHPQSEYATALNTISKILSNIINNPMEEKYRKVKRNNPAFTKRLGRLTNSHEVMMTIGFTPTTSSIGNEDEYTLVPSAEAWPKLTRCKQLIDDEIRISSSNNNNHNHQQQSTSSPSSIPDLGFGAIPPSSSHFGGGLPSMATNPSQALQMMDATLSNPSTLQSMLSNPMIQQMIMNDPRMRNNPMMQNAMRDFMNNPNMIQQMSQMMNDPTVRSSINAMMQQQQSFSDNNSNNGNAFGNGNNMTAQMEMMRQFANMNGIQSQQQSNSTTTNSNHSNNNGSNSNQQQQQQNQGGGNDTNARNEGDNEMTEEEMIAEAIARSLREQ